MLRIEKYILLYTLLSSQSCHAYHSLTIMACMLVQIGLCLMVK